MQYVVLLFRGWLKIVEQWYGVSTFLSARKLHYYRYKRINQNVYFWHFSHLHNFSLHLIFIIFQILWCRVKSYASEQISCLAQLHWLPQLKYLVVFMKFISTLTCITFFFSLSNIKVCSNVKIYCNFWNILASVWLSL